MKMTAGTCIELSLDLYRVLQMSTSEKKNARGSPSHLRGVGGESVKETKKTLDSRQQSGAACSLCTS